ncbi:hypothetical protein J5N97_004466 [Dioscorea zingiberensis]|uniref:nucleoside-diphosphate kinase n=1 Tax=Dioscorea zingiberensis TaxID=325984 RepID=A0A9D5D8K7_9LILI|nr:hypothetical protein J5N97_004466 [Dioscorea zingiberensis]
MSSQVCRSASRSLRSLLSARRSSPLFFEGQAVGAATATTFRRRISTVAAFYEKANSKSIPKRWISGALAFSAAVYMLQDKEVNAAELERTFIAIKPDGVQRGLIAEIISRFERKGYKLVAIKLVVPSKDFAQKHYHDLKERPFFNGLCNFLSSGPVLAMVWEGEGVIKYGRKLIGATDPQKSEPGTIRGDLAVVVGRNIIHWSDGPETAKDEISLWFEPSELGRDPLPYELFEVTHTKKGTSDLVDARAEAIKVCYLQLEDQASQTQEGDEEPPVVDKSSSILSSGGGDHEWRGNLPSFWPFATLNSKISSSIPMANKPLTPDMIALTEKKMDMSLDEIIKMSKKTSSKRRRHPRAPLQGTSKLRHFMDSRSSIRQGVLAQRRSSFHGNQFPVTREVAKSALNRPTHSRAVNWSKPRSAAVPGQKKAAEINLAGKGKTMANQKPQTLDALFKSMKQQRMVDTSGNGHLFPHRRQAQKQNQRGKFCASPVRIAS